MNWFKGWAVMVTVGSASERDRVFSLTGISKQQTTLKLVDLEVRKTMNF